MAMVTIEAVQKHLDAINLDIRNCRQTKIETGISPRFMDQKCTPDVVASCADWVLNLPASSQAEGFTTRMIWDSHAFENNVTIEYSKPSSREITARREFDKFIAQPLKTLNYSGVLASERSGGKIIYRVAQPSLLEFVSQGPRNARVFLVDYIERTLEQSGIFHRFEVFFGGEQTQEDYLGLRDYFVRFMLNNTPIKNEIEVRRIFPKVLNPLAHKLNLLGSESGVISRHPIMTSQLLYNKENFRDAGKKSKGQTREQARAGSAKLIVESEAKTRSTMAEVRERHGNQSELQDQWGRGYASQVHHIFPRSQFPALAAVRENLILLTPTQHNSNAHPRNNTKAVDFDYQIDCLMAKVESVRHSLGPSGDGFYQLDRLLAVINQGYPDIQLRTDTSIDELGLLLRSYQNGMEPSAETLRSEQIS